MTCASAVRRWFGELPGFGLSLGFTVVYVPLIVLLPLSAVFRKTLTVVRATAEVRR